MKPIFQRFGLSRTEQAYRWCVRLQDEDLSPGEQAAFDTWIQTDPRNAARFRRVWDIWNKLDAIAERPAVKAARGAALDTLGQAGDWRPPGTHGSRYQSALVTAASLMLVLSSSLYLLSSRTQAYEARVDAPLSVNLAGGSRLTLAPGSRVAADPEASLPAVTMLAGQAEFFARGHMRSMSVKAGDHIVVASGARFRMAINGTQLKFTLLAGRAIQLEGSELPSPKSIATLLDSGQPMRPSGVPFVTELSAVDRFPLETDDLSLWLGWNGAHPDLIREPIEAMIADFDGRPLSRMR